MTDSVNKHWAIIQDILSREGIAKQHLNSFDEFLKKGLQEIINEIDHIDIENAEYPYKIQLGRIQFKQPRMMNLTVLLHILLLQKHVYVMFHMLHH